MEFKLNGRTYCKSKCEKCGNEIVRRKMTLKNILLIAIIEYCVLIV